MFQLASDPSIPGKGLGELGEFNHRQQERIETVGDDADLKIQAEGPGPP